MWAPSPFAAVVLALAGCEPSSQIDLFVDVQSGVAANAIFVEVRGWRGNLLIRRLLRA